MCADTNVKSGKESCLSYLVLIDILGQLLDRLLVGRIAKQFIGEIKNTAIPQMGSMGAVLGSLLFLIDINDITGNIQSPIKLFADDTSLYIYI